MPSTWEHYVLPNRYVCIIGVIVCNASWSLTTKCKPGLTKPSGEERTSVVELGPTTGAHLPHPFGAPARFVLQASLFFSFDVSQRRALFPRHSLKPFTLHYGERIRTWWTPRNAASAFAYLSEHLARWRPRGRRWIHPKPFYRLPRFPHLGTNPLSPIFHYLLLNTSAFLGIRISSGT